MNEREPSAAPGLQPIGNQVSKTLNLLAHSASMRAPWPTVSETSGSAKLAKTGLNSTGPRPGGTGAVAIVPGELTAALQSQESEQIETALLRSLPPRLASSLVSRNDADWNRIGYRALKPIDPIDAQVALELLDAIDRPMPRPEIVKEIVRCLILTKSRSQSESDQAMVLAAFTEELAEFPVDVIRSALRGWARREKWWPALAEIREACQRAMPLRASLRAICRRAGV